MALSDLRCRQTRPTTRLQKLSDGGGLQLWIHPTGARWWRLAYRFKDKQKLLALGAFPTISLADARQARDEARRLLVKSIDPLQAKKDKQQERLENTFRILAEEYASRIEQEGRATKTISKTKWLLGFAYPILGDHPIDEIDSPLVLKALRKVEARGRYETACRRRSTIGRVFRHAIATGRGQSHPTAANPALSWRRPSLTCQVPAGPDAARPHREAWTRIRVCTGPSSHGSTIPSRLRRLARPQKANLVITILCWHVSEIPISKIQQIQPSDRRFDSVLDPIARAE